MKPRTVSADVRNLSAITKFRPKETYGTETLGILFSCTPNWIRKQMNAGLIPSRRIPNSKHRRIDSEVLKAFLRSDPCYQFYLDRLEWAEKLMALSKWRYRE